MTIKELLNDKTIELNENYLILSSLLNLSIPEVKMSKNKELSKKEYKRYKKMIKKLKKGVPVQYILKKTNFYGYDFFVNKHVLIPRPETEYLVETTDKLIKEKYKNKNIDIIDIGTGSGAIGISLKKMDETRQITATDISRKALKISKKNSKLNKVKIKYMKKNLINNINQKYDVVISNPPYIDKNSSMVEEKVIKNEPHLALFSEEKGLYCYKQILKNIKSILNDDYIIAFEIGENQKDDIKELIKEYLPDDEIIVKKDYNNFDRYIFIVSKE